MGSIRVLYLSYDGALEPLGQSQILPYLRGLASLGAVITLISFEKHADTEDFHRVKAVKAELAAQAIRWIPLIYHKRPALLATSFDLLAGLVRALAVVRKDRVQLVHARSYVPALITWILKRLFGVKFIFDMRGFWPDERVDGGLWPPGGFLYRFTKWLERRFLRDADEIITLTERSRFTVELCPHIGLTRVTVIPTCVDLERFSAPVRCGGPPNPSPVFIYTGSLGTWYLLGEMLCFVKEAINRFPRARLFLLTRNLPEAAREIHARGFNSDTVTVATADPVDVPTWLARSHAGLAFIKPEWSKRASCPTKIGEYLAMGLPVVVNDSVGDMAEVIGTNGVGAVLSEFSTDAYDRALDQLEKLWADPMLQSRCRRVVESYFSLQSGVDRYWEIYQRLV